MVAGAPFPDLLDWTMGEILEYVECRNEARKAALRDEAYMYFRQAFLISHVMSAKKGQEFHVMNEFPFLWTDEERKEAAQAIAEERFRKMTERMNKRFEEHSARAVGGEDEWLTTLRKR